MAELKAERWPPRKPKHGEVRAAFPRGRGRRTFYVFMRARGYGISGHTGTRCDNCRKLIAPGKGVVIERRLAAPDWVESRRRLMPIRVQPTETTTRIAHADCQHPDA